MKILEKILSFLFPVRMPSPLSEGIDEEAPEFVGEGIGRVRVKPYRDAIDRHRKQLRESERRPLDD